MTKGSIYGQTEPATKSVPKASAGDLEVAASVPASRSRVRRKAEQAKQEEGQSTSVGDNPSTASRSRASRTVSIVSAAPRRNTGRGSRLTSEGEDRLREAKQANRTVGEEADAFNPNLRPSSQQVAITNFQRGHTRGYDEGWSGGAAAERARIAAEEPSRVFRAWQVSALVMLGIIVGMLVGILAEG